MYKKRFSSDNTKVEIIDGIVFMSLFGNDIARLENDEIWISDGNYGASNTTVERLLPFIRIRKYKNMMIIDEKFEWDSKWFNVTQYKNQL
jgi:hypothetical protein